MSDFEEKLNSVLSNPDAMSQIMNLAQSLNLGGGGGESPQGGQGGGNEPPPPPPPSGGGDGLGGLAGLGSLLGQIDPKWINRLLPLVGELTGGGSDERMQLLYALRPFLNVTGQDI